MAEEINCLILMTTYNGQNFLKKQLDSIINQTFTNWRLLIRDDGSTDETLKILKEYSDRDARIEVLENHTGRHGAYANFWQLINYAYNRNKFDYYFFADQDDIWLCNKLDCFIEFAETKDVNQPLLIYSDMQVINEKDEVTTESLNKVLGIGEMSGYTEFYSAGFVWGCAAMINSALLFSFPPIDSNDKYVDIMSHDNFYTKACLVLGKVYYLDKPLIQHRRHSSNVTAGNTFALTPLKVLKKGLFGYKELAKTHAVGYNQTLITIKHLRSNGITSPITDEVETAILKGGVRGCKILKKHKVKRSQRSRTIGVYIVMLFKSYKKYLLKV